MKDFDEAKEATEEMFDNQVSLDDEEQLKDVSVEQEQQQTQDEQPAEAEAMEQSEQEPLLEHANTDSQIDEAANLAEKAAQTATQINQQLEQIMNENQRLKQVNEELQETITQQSQQQKEQIIDEAFEMPVLDLNRLAFEDEDTVRAMQDEYAQKMREYVKNSVMKDVEPAVEYAKEGMRQKEKAELMEVLKQVPELKGIDEIVPQLDRIIQSNKAFQSMPIDEQYINAYAIAKGVNAMNTPPPSEPTAEELMQYYDTNPEFQQLIEKKRLGDIKSNQQVPAMSASSGAVNAALNIQEKPKTWDDASQRTKNMFREDV